VVVYKSYRDEMKLYNISFGPNLRIVAKF